MMQADNRFAVGTRTTCKSDEPSDVRCRTDELRERGNLDRDGIVCIKMCAYFPLQKRRHILGESVKDEIGLQRNCF